MLEQLDPDQGTRSWLVKGWDAIGRLWSQEAAKEGGQVIREAQEADAAKSLMVQLHEKITAWPGMDGAIKQPGFLVRHLIASTGGSQGLYVMSTDPADGMGYYRKHPVSPQNLIATIRNSQLTGLIPTTLPVKKGVDTIPDRTAQSIINEHATIVKEVWIEPGLGHGGYISDIDKSGATLHIKAFSRNQELEDQAEPCTAVDEWLRAFFGVDYKIGCAWIAYSLAVEEGAICALSLKGKAGSGKKLLTQGLAECLQNPDTANGKDLVGDFNPGLLNSPFLVINEGWPASGRSAMHPADQFRSLVSGDPISVNQKFMAPVRVTCGVRIIITANNHGVVRNLTHGRDLSPEDREALACRLLHINIGEGAAAWLHDRGGMALTGKPGARWIRGDGGQLSNHILAKHFLWMYLNRHKHGEPGSRFLVTGNASKDILFELRTATGNSPLVIECLISMLESPGQRFSGLSVDDHGGTRAPRLFVLPSEILDYYRSNMRDRIGDKLTIAHVTSALQGLAVREAGESFVLPSRPEMGTKRWWEVDVWTLLEVAKKDGWKSPKLAGIVGAQQAERGAMQLLGTEAVT